MAGGPHSRLRQNRKALEGAEKLKRIAISAYLAEQAQARTEGHTPVGLHKIADKYGVGWRALSNHVKGGKTKLEWSEGNCHLTPPEAQALVDFALQMADWGFPLTHESL
jgi:hypothetical protein